MSNELVTVEIKGLAELQAKLEALPVKVAKKGLRGALKAGGAIFKNAMVQGAPKDTGFLSEHFNVKTRINSNELSGTAFIGPQGKIDYPDFMGKYRIVHNAKGKAKKIGRVAVATVARFLEFGTSKMAKKPFMTQAYETRKEAALEAVTAALKESLGL